MFDPWHGPSRYERAHPATGECVNFDTSCGTCVHEINVGKSSAPVYRCTREIPAERIGPDAVHARAEDSRHAWPGCTLYVRDPAKGKTKKKVEQ
jgi:hypothetical protein